MNKQELSSRVNGLAEASRHTTSATESVANWMGQKLPNVFVYAATSERTMEMNLAQNGKEVNGVSVKRETTFMKDLSIAEWCGGKAAVVETVQRSFNQYKNDEVWMAELVLCVNWKAWEHAARDNQQWAIFYSALYELLRDLVYDYYEGDEEKTAYLYDYLD